MLNLKKILKKTWLTIKYYGFLIIEAILLVGISVFIGLYLSLNPVDKIIIVIGYMAPFINYASEKIKSLPRFELHIETISLKESTVNKVYSLSVFIRNIGNKPLAIVKAGLLNDEEKNLIQKKEKERRNFFDRNNPKYDEKDFPNLTGSKNIKITNFKSKENIEIPFAISPDQVAILQFNVTYKEAESIKSKKQTVYLQDGERRVYTETNDATYIK